MPNYVMNKVCMSGSKEDLDEFIAFLKLGGRTEFDFNACIPMPRSLAITAPVSPTDLAIGEYVEEGTFSHMANKAYTGTVAEDMCLSIKKQTGKNVIGNENLMKAYMDLLQKRLSSDKYNRKLDYCVLAYKNLKNYGYTDWYDWCVNHWGTKWNAIDSTLLEDIVPSYSKTSKQWYIDFQFETAWNVPLPVFQFISLRFPNLSGAVDFADECYGYNTGVIVFNDGHCDVDTMFDNETYDAYCHSLSTWNHEELIDSLKQDEDGIWHMDYDVM